MITVLLQGRIGNNLFQYAAGRALALRHRTELVLDGSWADRVTERQFLHVFRLPLQATYERRHTWCKRISRKIAGIGPAEFHRGPVLIDDNYITRPDLHHAPDGAMLIGFYQSSDHFSDFSDIIRKELDLTHIQIPGRSASFEERLRSKTTVSIHVRRGDYLKIGTTQCIDNEYHARAIQHFQQRFENLQFCVFSDDINWCRARFSTSEFLFSDFKDAAKDPLHDIRLMSSCSHHIIVNSSYSWWGAWLNPKAGKTVISPAIWMAGVPAKGIVPDDWVQL